MEKGSAEITATAVVKAVQNYVKLSDEEISKTGFADKVYHIHLRYTGDNDELYFYNKSFRLAGIPVEEI